MASRARRRSDVCFGAALAFVLALSVAAPAQARPPEFPPGLQVAAASPAGQVSSSRNWPGAHDIAALASDGPGFWAPIVDWIAAWKSAIGGLITHVWKGDKDNANTCS